MTSLSGQQQLSEQDSDAQSSLSHSKAVLDDSPLLVVLLNEDGAPTWYNQEARKTMKEWNASVEQILPANRPAIHHDAIKTASPFRDIYHELRHHTLKWQCQPLPQEHASLWYGHDVTAVRQQLAPLIADQARYRLLVENSKDLISRHTKFGTFLYASPAAKTLLGYDPDELIGRSAYTDLFHREDLKALFNKDPRIRYERGYYQYKYRVQRKDGRYIWFETTSVTNRDPVTGELLDILCVSRDVTSRVENEKVRDWLARTVDATTDYVLAFSPEHRVEYANQAARETFQLPSKTKLTSLTRVYESRSVESYYNEVLPKVRSCGSWQGELEMVDKSGRIIPVLSVALAHGDEENPLAHITLLNRDITERKTAEALARQQQQKLAKAHRLSAAGELASQIAHELNQPLASATNYASGALNMALSQPDLAVSELQEPLEKLKRQVTRLSSVLKKIRQSIKRGHVQRTCVDLVEALNNARVHCEWQANEAGVSLEVTAPHKLPCASADPIQLEQVLVNLISNAVEACRHESPDRRRVELSAWHEEENTVAFRVKDYGPGIPEGAEEYIFQTFFSTNQAGLGMGLAISASIMEMLGGSLKAVQQDHPGACFVGTLKSSTERKREVNTDS